VLKEIPPDVRRQLDLRPNDEVVSFKRVAIVDGEPLAYIVNYLPRDIGMKIYEEDEALTFRPIAYLLRERYGISLTRADQTIDAVLAEPEVAAALDFPIGSPLLRIERTLFARKRPIQFTRSWYRSDRHKYAVTLSDWGGSMKRKKRAEEAQRPDHRGRTVRPQPLNLA